MKKAINRMLVVSLLFIVSTVSADSTREWVKVPDKMKHHMMANMRDHLLVVHQILQHLAKDELDEAAELAETRLGMSSMELHQSSHMSRFMPPEMKRIGQGLHRSASRFALKAQEGDLAPALKAFTEVTSQCVACHAAYRIH